MIALETIITLLKSEVFYKTQNIAPITDEQLFEDIAALYKRHGVFPSIFGSGLACFDLDDNVYPVKRTNFEFDYVTAGALERYSARVFYNHESVKHWDAFWTRDDSEYYTYLLDLETGLFQKAEWIWQREWGKYSVSYYDFLLTH